MQSQHGDELVTALQQVLTKKLTNEPELKTLLVALARVVLETYGEEPTTKNKSEAQPAEPPSQPAVIIAKPGEVVPGKPPIVGPRLSSEGIVPLKIGGVQMHLRVEGTSSDIARARMSATEEAEAKGSEPKHNTATPADDLELLELIAKRTALKMQACDVAKQRRTAEKTGEGKELTRQQTQTLIAEAKALPNCFLWMFMPGHDIPEDNVMDMMRDCYETLHLSAKVASVFVGQGSHANIAQFTQGMKMLAEAQSGLRLILKQSWMERDDVDQYDAFMWLRRTAEVQHIFVDRFMRLDDPADPVRAPQLRDEIRALLVEAEKTSADSKATKKVLNKIKYHAQRIADEGENSDPAEWRSLQTAVAGLPALDGRAREQYEDMMAPIAELVEGDGVPGDVELDGAFTEAMDAIYQKRKRRAEKAAERDEASAPRYSADVLAVRGRVAGKRLVLIGGTRFPQQEQRLRDAFELADFDWISLREHASSAPMEPVIAKADTAIVVAITRLAGHHHIDDARDYARKHDKLFVQLPAGHSPEQVAKAVMEQVGDRLAAAK
ncbi:MAG TPA: hypothetical protein VK157_05515 [Phycisphaerales bacterium]|nr:hypothetical protein [Phycisphaerales bacterium]